MESVQRGRVAFVIVIENVLGRMPSAIELVSAASVSEQEAAANCQNQGRHRVYLQNKGCAALGERTLSQQHGWKLKSCQLSKALILATYAPSMPRKDRACLLQHRIKISSRRRIGCKVPGLTA